MANTTGQPLNVDFIGKYKFLDNNNQVLFSGNVIAPPNYILNEFNVTELAQQFVSPPNYDKIFYLQNPMVDRQVMEDEMNYDWEEIFAIVNYDYMESIGNLSNTDINRVWLPSVLYETRDVFQNCTTLERVWCWSYTNISMNAFNGCTNLKRFTMWHNENNDTIIDEYAFADCENLEEVWLDGDSIINIKDHSFDGCRSLKRIYLYGNHNIPELQSDNVFRDTDLEAIYVDESIVDDYREADVWSTFSHLIMPMQEEEPTPMYSNYIMRNKLLYDTVSGNIAMPTGGYFKADDWGEIVENGYLHNDFIHRFTLATNENDLQYYYLWDYSGKNDYSSNFQLVRSWGVQDYVFPNQHVPLVVYNRGMELKSYYAVQGNTSAMVPDSRELRNSFATTFRVRDNVQASVFEIKTSGGGVNGTTIQSYKIDWCRNDNARTLYFINENGGLSWCQFSCKNIDSINATRNQIENNGIHNYLIQTHNSYTLNTDWLTDEQYRKIIQLFKSPTVWMHDYNANKIFKVVITDNKLTIKNKLNDKNYNYTITCKDAIQDNIYIS